MEASLAVKLVKIEPVESANELRNVLMKVSPRKMAQHCDCCGGKLLHYTCPAKGKTCGACNKPNYFAKVCRTTQYSKPGPSRPTSTKTVHAIAELAHSHEDMDDDVAEYTVHSVFYLAEPKHTSHHLPRCQILINAFTVTAIIDTGAPINIMAEKQYKALANRPPLQTAKV